MGSLQPSSLLPPVYPEGSRGVVGEVRPASTELLLREQKQELLGPGEYPSNPNTLEPARQLFAGPGRPLSGGRDAFRGNENKTLTAFSNRNSNDSRKLATLSEPTTSHFLIATKTHFSEEKAKSEEKTNLLETLKNNSSGGVQMLDDGRVAKRRANAERVSLMLESRPPHPRWVCAVRELAGSVPNLPRQRRRE
jgi:hypothetical protein